MSEPSDRELDALVSEKVMEWSDVPFESRPFHPSGDIRSAMEVVEKMRERGLSCVLAFNDLAKDQNGAKFFEGFQGIGGSIFDAEKPKGYFAVSNRIERAICLAALNACEVYTEMVKK